MGKGRVSLQIQICYYLPNLCHSTFFHSLSSLSLCLLRFVTSRDFKFLAFEWKCGGEILTGMFQSQQNSGFGAPKSWLSGELNSSPTHSSLVSSSTSNSAAALGQNGNLDRLLYKDLYNDLVEIGPLVQSLIDQKVSSSFTRRGSVVSTKTPSRDSFSKRNDLMGRSIARSIPTKKKREQGEKVQGSNNSDADDLSMFNANSFSSEKDREELVSLKEQVEDLQKKLLEKEELLKSAEITKSQIASISAKLDALKVQAAEKDSLMKSTHSQLSDAKIKLTDKQAALERIQWELMTSNRKVEKLEEELRFMQGDISSFKLFFESLVKFNSDVNVHGYEFAVCQFESDPSIDNMDEMEMEMEKMEEARKAYMAAVAAAKEKQDEESIASATAARLHLQSFVL